MFHDFLFTESIKQNKQYGEIPKTYTHEFSDVTENYFYTYPFVDKVYNFFCTINTTNKMFREFTTTTGYFD